MGHVPVRECSAGSHIEGCTERERERERQGKNDRMRGFIKLIELKKNYTTEYDIGQGSVLLRRTETHSL